MPKTVGKFLLPFSNITEDRGKSFTKEMEIAAILSLVQLDKGKGGGIISKRGTEEVFFVAEACYPLWLIPWEKRNLWFDGLNIVKHKQSFDVLPDVQMFNNEMEASAETCEAYYAFISDNIKYFRDFTGKEEKTIDGLITSSDLIQDFVSFLPEGKSIRKPMINKIVLSPALDDTAIESYIQEISDLNAELKRDIKSLLGTMKLLCATTENKVTVIRREMKQTQKDFDKKIAEAKSTVMKKRRNIKRNYDKEITNLSKTFKQQLKTLHKEQVKAEKDKEQLTTEIAHCETEVKSCRIHKDETRELQWRKRIEDHKKTLHTLEKKNENFNKRIEDINNTKTIEMSELRTKYDNQVWAVTEDLREIEASQEAATRTSQQEMESLEDLSSTIVNQINELLDQKEIANNEIEGLGIRKSRRRYTLVYLPFYLVCYQTGIKKRYMVYPPSIVEGMGILTKFRGVFGSAKIKSLLKNRSKAITNFLNQIVPLIAKNPVFENEISNAGIRANILRNKKSRESIKKGLEELKSEEWISESEFSTLKSTLSKY